MRHRLFGERTSCFILLHLAIAIPPHAHPVRKMRRSIATQTRLYSIHFCVAIVSVNGVIIVCRVPVFASSCVRISGMSVSGVLVHILTMNRLFHEWSTCAPGKTVVTSDCCSA